MMVVVVTMLVMEKTMAVPVAMGGDGSRMRIQVTNAVVMSEIGHAAFVLEWTRASDGRVIAIYNDPIFDRTVGQPNPDIILTTHPHKDHLIRTVIENIAVPTTYLVAPPDVVEERISSWWPNTADQLISLPNGGTTVIEGCLIEAIPAYNVQGIHPQGRWNGYVLTLDGERIYIPGDTDAVPAMAALTNISVSFMPMTPPFTCTLEACAEATLQFKPQTVYTYHYDAGAPEEYKRIVDSDPRNNGTITVINLDWYDNREKKMLQLELDEFNN